MGSLAGGRMGADREAWAQGIREKAERVRARISAVAAELARYRALKRARAGRVQLPAARAQVRACKAVLRAELRAWAQLSRAALRVRAA